VNTFLNVLLIKKLSYTFKIGLYMYLINLTALVNNKIEFSHAILLPQFQKLCSIFCNFKGKQPQHSLLLNKGVENHLGKKPFL
jgi:hypothetical protein